MAPAVVDAVPAEATVARAAKVVRAAKAVPVEALAVRAGRLRQHAER